MNVLLLSMPDVDSGYLPSSMKPPNLALCSLAGNLDPCFQATIADLVLRRKNVKAAILESLAVSRPAIVGISALTFQYDSAIRTAKLIKGLDPRIKIALGGYHATLMYEEIAQSEGARYFDFIFRGESDLSFNEALQVHEAGGNLEVVRGLSFKRNGRFVHNQARPLEELTAIGLPDRSRRLWKGYQVIGLPFDLAETSRGCLMQCKFCNIRNMYGRSFRKYEMSRVMQDLANVKRLGTKGIVFTDDNITLDIGHLDNLCEAIIREGHDDLVYGIQASPAGIVSSPPVVEKMARAGFKYVFLGIENVLSRNLRQWKKGHVPDDSRKAVDLLKDQGILISGGLIIGHPDDDRRDIEENFEFLRQLRVDFAGVQFLVPYPKTEMREELKTGGFLVNENDFKRYNGQKANVRTKHLTADQLTYLYYQCTKKFLKSRRAHHLRALTHDLRLLFRVFHAQALPLLAKFVVLAFGERLKDVFLTDRQKYSRYLGLDAKLNKFNI